LEIYRRAESALDTGPKGGSCTPKSTTVKWYVGRGVFQKGALGMSANLPPQFFGVFSTFALRSNLWPQVAPAKLNE